jgi:anti-sigma28 factor (negative regulator of flagellin synthesis)
LGRVTVPKNLDTPHAGLVQLLKQEKLRKEKFSNDGWTSTPPNFDTVLARRRLRILNGIFLALSKRGHRGDAYEHNGEIHARAIVGDTYLGLDITIVGKYRTVRQYGYDRPAPDLPATTPLILRLSPGFDGRATRSWEDDNAGELETRVAEIVADLIVAGEAKFRASLREEEERAQQARLEQERKRQKRLAELNQKRLQNLRESGDLLRQAQDIRSLVERVRYAIENGSTTVDEAALAAWVRWALAEADKIDPVLSGQFMTHLDEPGL